MADAAEVDGEDEEEVEEFEEGCPECPKCPPVGAPAWMATFAAMATLRERLAALTIFFNPIHHYMIGCHFCPWNHFRISICHMI